MINSDAIWLIISVILTLLIFSFALGDNRFFRFTSALFIGVSAGYFLVVLLYQVIIARLAVPLLQSPRVAIVPLLLSGLMLTKLSPRFARLGNTPMALLVGVGAAVAVGGAVLGTLFAQVKGALSYFGQAMPRGDSAGTPGMVEGVFFLVGTIATLLYFTFLVRSPQREVKPNRLSAGFSAVGKTFIAITLGAVFAGVLTAALTALVERVDFLYSVITMWAR